MKQNKKQTKSIITPKVVGVSVATIAAGVAGVYFLRSAKNRKKLKGWMLKMKGDALEKVENLKEVTEPVYHKVIDEVAKRYQTLKRVDQQELMQIIKELKDHWKYIDQKVNKKKAK